MKVGVSEDLREHTIFRVNLKWRQATDVATGFAEKVRVVICHCSTGIP
jgi:hypothetical protein